MIVQQLEAPTPLALGNALGASTGRYRVNWTVSDAVAIALAAGFTPDEDLPYLYEAHGPLVVPTMASVITGQWLVSLLDRLGMDRNAVVYRELSAELLRELRPEGAAHVTGKVEELDRRGVNARLRISTAAADADGPLIKASVLLVLVGQGEAKPESRPDASAKHGVRTTERHDPIARVTVPAAASVLYRLILPIRADEPHADAAHIDPLLAAKAGFKSPAVHGVTTLGILARAVLHRIGNARVVGYRGRFIRPVHPGQALALDSRPTGGTWHIEASRPGSGTVAIAEFDITDAG